MGSSTKTPPGSHHSEGMPWGRKGDERSWLRAATPAWSQDGLAAGRKKQTSKQGSNTVASLEELEQLQDKFERFLGLVNEDIETKTEYWAGVKKRDGWGSTTELGHQTKKLETYASIQHFMLRRYSKRISKFQAASVKSLKRISEVSISEEETKVLIATHMRILVKMKRRLKHMMDVSDKYFLTDLMDTIHLLGKATSELATPVEQFSVSSASSCSSFLSLDLSTSTSYLSLSSPSTFSSSSSSSSSAQSRPKLRPFRSLVDQLVVLSKTYTEQGE